MKYRLYDTSSEWVNKNESLEEHLNIPSENTFRYAEVSQVTNSNNAEYGKYIMPVCTSGPWKCDDQFNPSELVDSDPTWEKGSPGE